MYITGYLRRIIRKFISFREPRGQRNRKVFELTSSNYLQLILIKKKIRSNKKKETRPS